MTNQNGSNLTLNYFKKIRSVSDRLRTTTYEITSTCNLRCEGCLFYSGEHHAQHKDITDIESWDRFFAEEATRGTTYAFMAGAEPSLAIDRVETAWKNIPAGLIYTNGTKRIPDHITYRIHISIWGGDDTTAKTRGANINERAFRHYANDPRALFVFTVNAYNLHEILPMTERCRDNGVQITFNYFSPTETYLKELSEQNQKRSEFFRFSTEDDNMLLSPKTFDKAHHLIAEAKDRFPETVLYSLVYDDWVRKPGGVFNYDENNIATNCASLIDHHQATYFVDQKRSPLKCATPTFDCRECRGHVSAMASYVRNERSGLNNPIKAANWKEVFDCWDQIFVAHQWGRINDFSVIRKNKNTPDYLSA